MIPTTFRGVVRGRTVELLDAEGLPADGTSVVVTPTLPPGTAAALLAAMAAEPHVTAADVAELEAAIAAGRRPRAATVMFGDELGPAEVGP